MQFMQILFVMIRNTPIEYQLNGQFHFPSLNRTFFLLFFYLTKYFNCCLLFNLSKFVLLHSRPFNALLTNNSLYCLHNMLKFLMILLYSVQRLLSWIIRGATSLCFLSMLCPYSSSIISLILLMLRVNHVFLMLALHNSPIIFALLDLNTDIILL